MPLPEIRMTGNLTDNPELRYTGKGTPVCNFRLVTFKLRKNGDQWKETDHTYVSVVAWDKLAEQIAENLEKGSEVTVAGELKGREFDGQTRYEVTARHVSQPLPRLATRERPVEDPDDPWDTRPPDDPWAGTDTTEKPF